MAKVETYGYNSATGTGWRKIQTGSKKGWWAQYKNHSPTGVEKQFLTPGAGLAKSVLKMRETMQRLDDQRDRSDAAKGLGNKNKQNVGDTKTVRRWNGVAGKKVLVWNGNKWIPKSEFKRGQNLPPSAGQKGSGPPSNKVGSTPQTPQTSTKDKLKTNGGSKNNNTGDDKPTPTQKTVEKNTPPVKDKAPPPTEEKSTTPKTTVFTRHYKTGERLGVMTKKQREAYEKEAGTKTFEGQVAAFERDSQHGKPHLRETLYKRKKNKDKLKNK